MKKKEQRINEIYSFLQESPSLSVKDLSEMLNVSEMTIRRDLKYLKENNLFVRAQSRNPVAGQRQVYDYKY